MSIYPATHSLRISWLVGKLGLDDIQPPFISPDAQRERIRRAIIEQGVADKPVGHSIHHGQMSYAQCFRDLWGQPLQTDELDFGVEPDSAA